MNLNFAKPLDLVDKPILLENQSQKIVYANRKALKYFEDLISGWKPIHFHDHFKYYGEEESICISKHSGQLYILQKDTVSLNDSVYKKITLNPLSDTLDPPILHSYMEMAEKFVHQFRSPLTGAHGYLEMFMEQITLKEEPSTSYLSKMEKGLDQSFQLLNQIEEFATPVSIENSTFSLNSFILSIFENFDEDDIRRISISKPKDPVEFHSDFFILRKIVIELIRNGLEASPEANEKKVWVKFHNEGIIEVKNTLMNFPEENLKRIFLPFYSTKALQMGLGLPKCRLYSHKLHLDFQVGYDTEENEISFQISGYPFTFD